jgi:hypothetical protein
MAVDTPAQLLGCLLGHKLFAILLVHVKRLFADFLLGRNGSDRLYGIPVNETLIKMGKPLPFGRHRQKRGGFLAPS